MTRVYIGIAVGSVSAFIIAGFLCCFGLARGDPIAVLVVGTAFALAGAALGAVVGGMRLMLDELEIVQSEVRGLRWQCEHEYQSLVRELKATITEIRSLRWQDQQTDAQEPTAIKEL